MLEDKEEQKTNSETQTDNQGNLNKAQADSGADKQNDSSAQKADSAKTTSETSKEDGEVKFSDPNMQKAWTEKTTALAEERKKIDTERVNWTQEKEKFSQVEQVFKSIINHPEFNEWYESKFKAEEGKTKEAQIPELTDDQYYEILGDKNKLQKYIMDSAKLVAEQVAKPLNDNLANSQQELKMMRLEKDISDFAETEDHKDFWKLDDLDLIEPMIVKFVRKEPNLSNLEIIDKAYNEAKRLVETLKKSASEEATAKAHGIVEDKKKAISDKGNISDTSTMKKTGKRTIEEIVHDNVKRLGINWSNP